MFCTWSLVRCSLYQAADRGQYAVSSLPESRPKGSKGIIAYRLLPTAYCPYKRIYYGLNLCSTV